MSNGPLDLVVLGLSLSSSWGNGHATPRRALLRGLAARGHRVLFLERDVPWYAEHRDLPDPDFCELAFYSDMAALRTRFSDRIRGADAVLVGSYVPDGIAVLDLVLSEAAGVRAFYDIDTPVTLAALARGDCSYLAAEQIARLDLSLSFTGGPTLRRTQPARVLLRRGRDALPARAAADPVGSRLSRHIQPRSPADARSPAAGAGAASA